jgi:hypothetical protein
MLVRRVEQLVRNGQQERKFASQDCKKEQNGRKESQISTRQRRSVATRDPGNRLTQVTHQRSVTARRREDRVNPRTIGKRRASWKMPRDARPPCDAHPRSHRSSVPFLTNWRITRVSEPEGVPDVSNLPDGFKAEFRSQENLVTRRGKKRRSETVSLSERTAELKPSAGWSEYQVASCNHLTAADKCQGVQI